MFLQLDGIQGEVSVTPWHNWIEVFSVSWGSGGGSGAPKADLREITLTAPLGISLPGLQMASANGNDLGSAELVFVRNNLVSLRLKMTSVIVAACYVGGGGTPNVQFILNFETSKLTYDSPPDNDQHSVISPEEARALRTAHSG